MSETTTTETKDAKPVALTVIGKTNLPKAAIEKFEVLNERAEAAVVRFQSLATEAGGLTEAGRAMVQGLMGSISPHKKGVDEEFGAAWQIPEINMNQPTTRLEGRPDTVRNGDLLAVMPPPSRVVVGILKRPLKFRVLATGHENLMFIEDQKQPECQAPDAKIGTKYGECAACQYFPLGHPANKNPNAEPTDCNYHLTFLIADEEMKNLYMLKFKSTSLKAGRALVSMVKALKGNIWEQTFQLATEEGPKNSKGLYYIFKITPGDLDPNFAADTDGDKICDAVVDVFTTVRDVTLNRYYAGILGAGKNAAAGEQQFNRDNLAAGLGDEGGVEPDLGGGSDTPKAGSGAPQVRKTSTPM